MVTLIVYTPNDNHNNTETHSTLLYPNPNFNTDL